MNVDLATPRAVVCSVGEVMEYRRFDLQLVPDGPDGVAVHARASSGEDQCLLPKDPVLCLSAAQEVSQPEVELDAASSQSLRLPLRELDQSRLGGCLFKTLLSGNVGELFHRARGEAKSADQGLAICLRLNPQEPRLARLAQLPWEMLFDPQTQKFLCLDRATPIVRVFNVHDRPTVSSPRTGKRLLLAAATPRGLGSLDAEDEFRRIRDGLDRSDLEIEELHHATHETLGRRLRDGRFDLIHLTMHGDLDPITGRGALFLEYADGTADEVSGPDFARHFHGLDLMPRLVVLNACLTAASATGNPLTSVAAAMVLGGCPAVIATSSPIFDEDALRFSERFYERLGAGDRLEEALTEGRLALCHSERLAQWAIPCLFLSPETRTDVLPPSPPKTVPVPEVETTSRPRRGRGPLLVVAAAVIFLAVGVSLWWKPWGDLASSKPPASNESLSPVEPSPTSSSNDSSTPATRHFEVREGKSALRFTLRSAKPLPDDFELALQSAAEKLVRFDVESDSFRLDGWTAELEIAPFQTTPVSSGRHSCRSSASTRLRHGDGRSVSLGSLSDARTHVDPTRACVAALNALAQPIVDQLAQHFLGD